MTSFRLEKEKAALLVIDVQEGLFSAVERSCEVMGALRKVVGGFRLFQRPIVATEQYPQGLGPTMGGLKDSLGEQQEYWSKTSLSCLGDSAIKEHILSVPATQWVLVGIETHVCVLQTARDLIETGKEVVVVNDAITSRSIFDFSTAIAEVRDMGARVSSAEIVLFELVKDSAVSEFRSLLDLINAGSCAS